MDLAYTSLANNGGGAVGARITDHTGSVYNHLIILSFSRIIKGLSGSHKTMWLARCTCSKECEVDIALVIRGKRKSCGCITQVLKSKNSRLPDNMETFNRAYATHSTTAKKRGYTTLLSKDEYIRLVKSPCRYCGEFSSRKTRTSLNNNLRPTKYSSAPVISNSVDRLDNEPYYSLKNSVPACFKCQQMKWTNTEKEFYDQIERVLAHRDEQLRTSEACFYSQFDSIGGYK